MTVFIPTLLSNGQPRTLAGLRALAIDTFGADSYAVKTVDGMIRVGGDPRMVAQLPEEFRALDPQNVPLQATLGEWRFLSILEAAHKLKSPKAASTMAESFASLDEAALLVPFMEAMQRSPNTQPEANAQPERDAGDDGLPADMPQQLRDILARIKEAVGSDAQVSVVNIGESAVNRRAH